MLQNNLAQITKEVLFSDSQKSILNIIHFNDVYNIESNTIEPKAGAARFKTLLNQLKEASNNPTLVLFSGDAFSPSALSLITKGKQMLACLNKFDIDAACIGNHDFDFGVDILKDLVKESNFPWMISNCLDINTKQPLADAKLKHILQADNLKIGLIGLVEQEWIETLSTIGYDDLIYQSFVDTGKRLANELKNIDKCDIVIALTHMRTPNDVKLANDVEEIDLILGGHDHHYLIQLINNNKWIIKSGTDFRNLTLIELNQNLKVNKIEKFTIDSNINEDKEIAELVQNYLILEDKESDLDILAKVLVDLDSRFTIVRLQESNIANLICDILLEFLPSADCCIVNSGTFRSDCINEAGLDFTLGHLKKIIPFADQIVMLKCIGHQIHEALENSVCTYPKLEGRFPQVAGIQFEFDSSKPPSQRIDPAKIKIKNNFLILDNEYKVVVKAYMKEGKDGFKVFTECPVLVDEEQTPLVFTIVENYFRKKRIQNENFAIKPLIEQRIIIKKS